MRYLIISFSHKNSSIEIREKLSYPNDSDKDICLKKLNESVSIDESVLISTCNRVEVMSSCNDIEEATKHIFSILSIRAGLSVEELKEHADIFDGSSAIHHIFSVASSLDSMVIGETQIAGQLKDAFRYSYDKGHCSKNLARAMKSAFSCAAKVRNATDISSKPVSMASVAVAKLKSIVDDLESKKVLIIGVGEMSEITAKHLISAGCDVSVMNRTEHKAKEFASKHGVKQVDYKNLGNAVNEFQIIFTATSAPEAIIKYTMIDFCNFERFWFDLALPRDIESFSRGDIQLFVIDDLEQIVDENMGLRKQASRKAQGIIGREIIGFFESLATLDIEPVIKEIYTKAYQAAAEETSRVVSKGFIPTQYENEAKKMCEQAIKRFLHDMTSAMRSGNDASDTSLASNMVHMFTKSLKSEKFNHIELVKETSEKK